MEDIPESLIDTFIKVMYNGLEQHQSDIKERKRRDELRKGSIDVEYKVIE